MFKIRRFGGVSPCIGICTYDKNDQYCVGCYRTNKEISAWHRFSEIEKQKIILDLPKRAVKLKNIKRRT